jgi:tRNA A-37 threonylcarbamoyl transferase component Bud32
MRAQRTFAMVGAARSCHMTALDAYRSIPTSALELVGGAHSDDSGSYGLLAEGSLCGRYRVLRLIARGGMSEIYEAEHVDLKKRVALKVLSSELHDSREAHARFSAEAINAAAVSHSNIAEVTDFGRVHGLPYLVMALLAGFDLATLFSKRGRLRVTELVDLLLPVANAVAVGHDQGIIHRDLKPANIFLHHEDGRVLPKVLDFGVSRMLSARRITVNANVFGTPHYMAPEQARGEKGIDPRADQYALGVVLYEGVTGRLPRDEQHPHVLLYAVAYGSFTPPSAYSVLPDGFERVIMRAMQRDPNQRYSCMRELAAALLPYASPLVQAQWAGLRVYARGGRGALRDARAAARDDAAVNTLFGARSSTQEVLDVPALLRFVGNRPGLIFGVSSILVSIVLACVWLVESGLPALWPSFAGLSPR